jgi:hypothetical protein
MARFAHLRVAGVQWQHGVPGPWAAWTQPERGTLRHDTADHSTATVHHAEQPFTLEVMPDMDRQRSDAPLSWTWGLFQNGRDPDNHHVTDSEWTFPAVLAKRHNPDHDPATAVRGNGSGYYGGGLKTREEAMRDAEEAWEAHKARVDSRNPLHRDDYDLDSFMRDHDPDEGYDIFGGGR